MQCTASTEVYVDKEQKIKPLFHYTYRRIRFVRALTPMQFLQITRIYHSQFQRTCSIRKTVLIKRNSCIQALTNLLLNDVRSRTPILQYLFVKVLPYQNIYTCSYSRKCLTRFSISTVFFLSQRQYASGFPNFSLMLCLQYT